MANVTIETGTGVDSGDEITLGGEGLTVVVAVELATLLTTSTRWAHVRVDGRPLPSSIVGQSATVEPVTIGGWYERADGTVGRYAWHDGQVRCIEVVGGWAEVPSRDYAAEDRASRVAP